MQNSSGIVSNFLLSNTNSGQEDKIRKNIPIAKILFWGTNKFSGKPSRYKNFWYEKKTLPNTKSTKLKLQKIGELSRDLIKTFTDK